MGKPKKGRRLSQPERIAYHEAGHIAVSLALSRAISLASIRPSKEFNSGGYCLPRAVPSWCLRDGVPIWTHAKFDKRASPRQRAWMQDYITISCAGSLAESKATRSRFKLLGHDRAMAFGVAESLSLSREESRQLVNWATARAKAILNCPPQWRAVGELAAHLLLEGHITGESAKQLIFLEIEQWAIDKAATGGFASTT
jgi:hypothetical protein